MRKDKIIKALKVEQYLQDNPAKKAVKDQFIEMFILCEMECKDAILEYWHSEDKKLDVTDTENIRLRMDSIQNALGPKSGYRFSDDLLMRLFGGRKNKHNPYKTKGIYSRNYLL